MSFNFTDEAGDDVATLRGKSTTLKRALSSITGVKEAKLTFENGAVSTSYVDAANVMMGELLIPSEALDHFTYNRSESRSVVGMNVDELQSALQPARVSADDLVTIEVAQKQTDSYIDRSYGEGQSTYHDAWRNMDPDALRQEPEMADGLDLIELDVGVTQLYDVVKSVGAKFNHIAFESSADGLRISGSDDTTGREVNIHGEFEEKQSTFSKDYTTDIVDSVKSVQADDVTLHLGDEMPIIIEWKRDDGIHGKYMQAPRIEQ